ncbi:amidase [Paenibacillus melissococcoides]|uniref:Amidase n=1 Tax=Paenibacillus melissococcoides TaxID=2912268 RepID=A0ABM9FYY8_9BACL|nr:MULTISPECIES: amidase [Paenibacillus]MEB9895599.1 amidase [Bacillus cereus]CAH8244502.1 amidase [Paenibacillus melissococcoides]CAH8708172.1 amidase [Paenibacillus melissococcoides]CAH8708878.1 amidase [Paenibacillus melissococcoides]GIO80407.1 amidase [Paenibacillus dendritiformis]
MKRRSIRQLLNGYKYKLFSPVEITRDYLREIKNCDPVYNAYITVTKERALRKAKRLEKKWNRGKNTGLLFGIPLSYKDNLATKGVRTTNGSEIYRSFVPDRTAAVIRRANKENAIMLGKTNMHEFALGITSNNPHYGPVRNPWNIEYSPGGSSGGSAAAVAANLSVASIGTETGGSVRIPAASCGIAGLKPTYGTVPTSGVDFASWTMDHVGPLAANMEDLAIMMDALTGNDYSRHLIENIRGMRIGVPINFFNEHIEKETQRLYREALAALEELGAVLADVDTSFLYGCQEYGLTIAASEAGYVHRSDIACCLTEMGADVRAILELSLDITSLQYITALHKKEEYTRAFKRIFKQVDVLATPTLPIPPRRIGVESVTFGSYTENIFDAMTRYTEIFNMTGMPALTLPCGITKQEQLPVGLQLIADHRREDRLIRAGYTYEQSELGGYYRKRDQIISGTCGS